MILTDLADILRDAGLTVTETPGWRQRGRGPMSGIRTIVCHHTGGPSTPADGKPFPSLTVIRDGRDLGTPTELRGPLAQLGLAFDGTWHVIAAGRANHAGRVRHPDWANEWAIGIEAQNNGRDPWPQAQLDSYARGCAALVRAYRLTVEDVRGHKEICDPPGRKTDPSFDMTQFRDHVKQYVEEDGMPGIPELLAAPLDDAATDRPGDTVPLGRTIAETRRWALHSATRTADISRAVAEQAATLTELTAAVARLTEAVAALQPPPPPPA